MDALFAWLRALLLLRENRTHRQPALTHVVLEPLDFMFRMNGMPRAQGEGETREPGLTFSIRLVDMEWCPACGGKLRVIACIEDLPLIAQILGHVQRREALTGRTPRAPPDSRPVVNLT